MEQLRALKPEVRPLLRLAIPLVLAEMGWMGMVIVDTMMVGRLPASAVAMGAVGVGGAVYYAVAIGGSGLLLGLDTLVSQAYGAGKLEECHRSLFNGVALSLLVAPLLMAVVWLAEPLLGLAGVRPAVLRETRPYLNAVNWSTLPLLLYFGFRRYLQGMNHVKPILFALISANLVNLGANWVLIFGHLGMPALGVPGAGWATCVSRSYMAAVLLVAIIYADRRDRTGLWAVRLRAEAARLRQLVRLGLPAALQMVVEVAVFATATALIGRLDPVSLAGHQIALNTASFTYMMPLGVSSAAAVRVGQALGRNDVPGARRAGAAAILLGAGLMSCSAVAFLLAPRAIARLFTPDAAVVRMGAMLLLVAAFFQLFDGIQTVATGALRGAGDTHTPFFTHLVCYWLVGLPVGAWLCFGRGWGAVGLWVGLSLALILIGLVLLAAWRRTVRRWEPAV